jgi:hypothetical protein
MNFPLSEPPVRCTVIELAPKLRGTLWQRSQFTAL